MKVAIVTGASAGIGEATVLALLHDGFVVYAGARRTERMQALATAGARLLALDVTDEDSMSRAVEQVLVATGRVDVLVNNAGYGSHGAVEDVPMEEARRQMDVNVFGLARMTQLVLPAMRAQRGGTVVNISSIGGKMHEPLGAWYHATKFAVEGLSDCLRMEVKPFGIHVVVIEPGAITSEWVGIAAANLEKTSQGSAYEEQVTRHLRIFKSAVKGAKPPKVVADAIVKAVNSTHPKTRYVMGGGAKPILWLRKLLPDKAFDALMGAVLKRM